MKVEDIRKVAVIGAGVMGSQIAELFSRVGKYEVVLCDLNEGLIAKGLNSIKERLQRYFLEKGKISQVEFDQIIGRIRGTVSISEAAEDADFIVEAVIEKLEVKKEVFGELDKFAKEGTIFTSNTSFLNITEIAKATQRVDRVIGTHFFNPVAVMKLVEVIKGPLTSPETVELTCSLMRKLEKEPLVCKDFSFGFLANRAYDAMADEAIQMVWERVASPAEIDKALRLGYNLPMGPLEMRDFVGAWRLIAESEEERIEALGEKGRLHPLIKMMVRAGYDGRPKGIYAFWEEVMSKW